MTARPFVVLRAVTAAELANHYDNIAERVPYDASDLVQQARQLRAEGNSKSAVSRHRTCEDAEVEVKRLNSMTTLPGVTFHVDHWDG